MNYTTTITVNPLYVFGDETVFIYGEAALQARFKKEVESKFWMCCKVEGWSVTVRLGRTLGISDKQLFVIAADKLVTIHKHFQGNNK